jgi:hypothetical protein
VGYEIPKSDKNRFNGFISELKISEEKRMYPLKNTIFVIHNPRFKPWAMNKRNVNQNRFNGL